MRNTRNTWCWAVVAGSHLAQSLSVGASSILGIMLNAWVEYFDVPVKDISNVIAILPSVIGVAGFAAGFLCGRVGYRSIAIVGGVVTSLGMMATSFAQNIAQLYIFFGITTSIGIGLTYTSSVMVLGSYFSGERLVLANGISFSGISTGQFILPPLLVYLYAQYGWRGGTLLLAGLKMNLVVGGALFRPTVVKSEKLQPQIDKKDGSDNKNMMENEQYRHKTRMYNNIDIPSPDRDSVRKLCHNYHYLLSLLVVFLIAITQFGGMVFMIPRATDAGIPPFKASLIVTLSAVSGVLGSLGHGLLIRRKCVTMQTMFLINSSIGAISLLLNPLSDHLAFLVVDMCVFSLSLGVISALIINPIPRELVECSTPSLVNPAIGVVILTSALGQTGGMISAGFLHDLSGSYTIPYLSFGAILSLATVVFLPLHRSMRKIADTVKRDFLEE